MTGGRTRRAALAGGALAAILAGAALACGGAQAPAEAAGAVPPEARALLTYVRQHGFAPPDHLGGRVYPNYDGALPRFDARGKRLLYREWEVRPKAKGGDGGRERLGTSGDGRAWYTGDGGRTFTEVQ